MTPVKNGTATRLLVWSALMCAAFLTAAIFVSERGDAAVDDKCKLRYSSVDQKLNQMIETLNEVRRDVKTHIKEDR